MVPYSFTPDWLISPPPNSPYLTKQENITQLNKLDKLLFLVYNFSNDKERIEFSNFQKYILHDHPKKIEEAREHVKKIQESLENERLKLH